MGLHFIKNGTKHDVCVKRPSLFPASATTYDNSQSGLSATRVQGAIDELAKPTFTEASTRANIASGDTLSTILGKIKKFFTDLKTVAFTGAYSDLSGTPDLSNVAYKNVNNQFSSTQTIDTKTGTVSSVGISYLILGNSTAEGNDKNSEGAIAIYGKGTKLGQIRASDITNSRFYQLPDKDGTIALTSDVDATLPKTISSTAFNANETKTFALDTGYFYTFMTHHPYNANSGLYYISRWSGDTGVLTTIKADSNITISYSSGVLTVTSGSAPTFGTLVKVSKLTT